ncbi:MAG: GTP-binding protein, partial [Clostridia bacterium]|nr:GTP-binding protein [Clostridia bacterium]
MAKFDTKSIRNIALLGHGGSGKTSLVESMLYIAGATDRLGKVADGNTVCDYDAEEIKRGFTLSASVANIEWKGIKINILDTPGYLDFAGEVNQALRVAGSAVITVDAKAGVEVGTELAWDSATAYGVPKVFFVNKCDDPEANFDRVFKELDYKFGRTVCPVFVPVGDGKDITMLDLIAMKAYKYDYRGQRTEVPVLDEYMDVVSQYREALNEALAGTSDELMEKYFNGEEISKEEAIEALHQGIIDGTITPVYCGSATNVFGVIAMLDAISESFPRFTAKKNERVADGTLLPIDVEGDPAIFVFKTVADQFVGKMSFFKVMSGTLTRDMVLKNNVTGASEKMAHLYVLRGKTQTEVDELACGDIGMIAKLSSTNTNDTLCAGADVAYRKIVYPNPYMCQAMIPVSAKDEGKISQSIAKMVEEDLTLRYENNAETKQMLIYGLGDIHLSVLAAKLKSRFGVSVNYGTPRIAYREKITKRVDVEGKHKKQNGG